MTTEYDFTQEQAEEILKLLQKTNDTAQRIIDKLEALNNRLEAENEVMRQKQEHRKGK